MLQPYELYEGLKFCLIAVFIYVFIAAKRINKMVDIVTNRMFDTFNKFSPRDTRQNDSLATIKSLKRFSADLKQRKTLSREAETKARDSLLFDIKENAPPAYQAKKKSSAGLSCASCTPESRETLVSTVTKNLPLKNVLNWTPAQSSKYGLVHKVFSHLSQVYELQKFDFPQVAGTVLQDARLKLAIKKTASELATDNENADEDYYQTLLKNNEKRAKKLLYDMRSTLSDFLLRFTSWVLYKLLPCFLSSVVIPSGHVEMLKKAGKTGLPLIFLPLHRSHLDYILISFILLNNNVRSPLVAAGDNLRIPFFGSLLRGLGAFFIKRRVDPIMGRKDHVYKAVLHTYMNECLRAGHNIEFFLEGGRTRTGKPCMPKYGILSVIVESFMDGTIEDALLVPVGINYERLVDGNFVREQLGQAKEMETFSGAMKGIWHVLNSNYGMMRIDFNQPFSLRELVKTFNTNGKIPKPMNRMLKSNPSTNSLYGTDVVSDEHKSLVENISKHVLFDCAQTTAVMSTNAVAFLLLNKFRNGVTIDVLVDALDSLRRDLAQGNKEMGFTGDSLDVITYAVDLLGPGLVRKEKVNNEEIIKPIAMLPNVIELAYYSNTLMAFFVMDAIIATSLHSLDAVKEKRVVQGDLVEACVDLCDILQYEFIFCKPCQNLENYISECIEDLNIRKSIFMPKATETFLSQKSRRLAQQFDDDYSDDDREDYVYYELDTNEESLAHLEFLKGCFAPLVEAYSVTALTLDKLVGRQLLENELITDILDEMKRQLAEGTLKYEESVSVDQVKNALKYYQKAEVLECHQEKKLRLYYLRETYDNSENISLLYNKINKYRIPQ